MIATSARAPLFSCRKLTGVAKAVLIFAVGSKLSESVWIDRRVGMIWEKTTGLSVPGRDSHSLLCAQMADYKRINLTLFKIMKPKTTKEIENYESRITKNY